jgi:hypothetical protein
VKAAHALELVRPTGPFGKVVAEHFDLEARPVIGAQIKDEHLARGNDMRGVNLSFDHDVFAFVGNQLRYIAGIKHWSVDECAEVL